MSEQNDTLSPLHVEPQPVPRIGKSERTRAAILNAALDFLWSHPFRDMTVASLMTSTGVSRSAFYQYFNDLHEVMVPRIIWHIAKDCMSAEEIEEVTHAIMRKADDQVTLHRLLDELKEACR